MIMALITTILIFAAETPADAKLDYNSTLNKSMSKFQRINHIEDYLVKLKDGVSNLDEKVELGMKGEVELLKVGLASLEKKVELMSEDIKKIKEILKPSKDKKEQ